MSFEIAKAGWLFRLSSILRRWKKAWFVLYTDGVLKYFDSPDSHVAEEALVIPAKCVLIKSGTQVTGVTPPPGMDAHSLLMIVLNNNESWSACAESPDDMKAWEIALNEARVLRMQSRQHPQKPLADNPPPYSMAGYPNQTVPPYNMAGYPTQTIPPYATVTTTTSGYPGQQQVYYGTHPPPYVVQSPPGQTTVIYADQQPGYYYDRRGYDGTDVALGVVAGAAIGSMMWGPLLWW